MCLVYAPGPAILLANMMFCLWPVFLNHVPIILSVSPYVSASAGTG